MPALDEERHENRQFSDFNIGTNIRHLRVVADMEQSTLAKLADINQSQLSRIEKGTRSLRFGEGMAIAKILGVRPERLTKEVID